MAYLRTWQELDLGDVGKQLLVVGELSAECYNCHNLGLDSKDLSCPECGAKFRYIGFRRQVRPKDFIDFKRESPRIELIDFSDFKRALSKKQARNILDV